MRRALGLALILTLAWNATAQARDAHKSRFLFRLLEEELATKDFLAPMNFKEAVELLMQKFRGRGMELRIIVDAEAFVRSDGTQVYNSQVKFQPYLKMVTARDYLEQALSGVQPARPGFTIRRGTVFITTAERAAFPSLRREIVRGAYSARPFAEILEDLADQVGADVTIDKRMLDKAGKSVTITFRNSTLDDAVALLADQAGLRAVALTSGFYVTSRENAERIERELDRKHKATKKTCCR
ncbi:MAG: hypothetical protein FJ271_22305 [Planctomycetes bacterium]|nr:hypothetical protein [Planctomycetota bacterium]